MVEEIDQAGNVMQTKRLKPKKKTNKAKNQTKVNGNDS
jgi:hypothetical protein